jgi:transketolase
MRREFIESLVQLARRDERIVLMTGDLGFAALEPFAQAFPDRFFNVGVAEQNMVGMATGLAEAGFVPYVYSISTFASMRAYEFIRNGPVVHGLPVRIVGVGEGADYSHNGITHYALEDVALMRAQPGLSVVTPATAAQVGPLLDAVQTLTGPAYIRLSKTSVSIPELPATFELGRAQTLGTGDDVTIVALGAAAEMGAACVEKLADVGVHATLLAVTSVTPAPIDQLRCQLTRTPLALSVEAGYINGGLGSLVAEVIAEHGLPCRLIRAGVRSTPVGLSGSVEFMNDRLGLSPRALTDRVLLEIGARTGIQVR